MDASTPFPALGEGLVKAGQFWAHVPVQAVVVPLSFRNRYKVMPFESTRMLPNVGLSATLTVSPLLEDDEPVSGVAGGAQAANTSIRPNEKGTNKFFLNFYLQTYKLFFQLLLSFSCTLRCLKLDLFCHSTPVRFFVIVGMVELFYRLIG